MNGGQIGNVDLVKQLNSAIVYRLIDQQGPISRIQVAEISQLAPASVTKITRQLLKRGLIKEVAQQASTGGRRATSLTTETRPFHSIAIRLGRDDIQISLYDLSGTELANQYSFFQYKKQHELIKGIILHTQNFINKNNTLIKNFIAISITLPGLIDVDTGVVEYIPNTEIDNLPLGQQLKETFGVEAFVGNDIRGLALAEHFFGASLDCQDSILVSVYHGTGAGIIVNGQVFLGANRNVGEIGHVQIDPVGELCQCGHFGCLETVASNPAIIKHISHKLHQGYPSSLAKITPLTIDTICEHANQGDELALQTLTRVGNELGKAIAMAVNLFNPQKILIAGNILKSKDIIFHAIDRNIQQHTLPAFYKGLPIVESVLYTQPTIGAFSMIKRAMLNGVLLQKLLED